MKQQLYILFFLVTLAPVLNGQTSERREKIELDGQIVTALITDNDTIIIADLEDVSISSLRKFDNRDDYRKYLRYRRYAAVVYPYANDAIKIFREVEYTTQNMKKRKRKKHIKRLNKQLKKEFKDPLKKLTKTQGYILIKMIEKELDTPFYTLIKNLRGGVSASFWQGLGKINGYDLKRGYHVGDDPLLDAVLKDFNISHEVIGEN